MPRVKASPSKCVKSTNPAIPTSNSWIFFFRDGTGKNKSPEMVKLRHPATGQPAMFVFSPNDDTVQEVLTFHEEKRSWFIDNSVRQDGKLHLSTPFDPVFLVLPYLLKANAAVPLPQLLQDDEFPETIRLLKCSGVKNLSLVADRKGDDDLNAFKLNEDRTLSWLKKKTERVADVLRSKNVHVAGGSISATFVKSKVEPSSTTAAYMKYAHGIVSEYLTKELSLKLYQYLGFPPEEMNAPKRKSSGSLLTEQKDPKKLKTTGEEQVSSTSDVVKGDGVELSKIEKQPDKVSAKEKARQKAAQGSKSITSFFKKM